MIHELYDGEIKVQFSEASHRYKVLSPSKYVGAKQGVTTPLSVLAKDNLVPWAANMAVETFVEAYDSLAGISRDEFYELCKKARNAHRAKKEDSADIGKQVHKWIENHVKGNGLEIYNDIRPSVEAFLKWEESHKPEYLFSERVVYSKKYDYCGTTDIGAIIDGRRGILDLKTGQPDKEYNTHKKFYTGQLKARSTHLMQDGGYDQAILEEDGISADFYGVIYLPLDGSLHYFTNSETGFWRKAFTQVLETSRTVGLAEKINKYEVSNE